MGGVGPRGPTYQLLLGTLRTPTSVLPHRGARGEGRWAGAGRARRPRAAKVHKDYMGLSALSPTLADFGRLGHFGHLADPPL